MEVSDDSELGQEHLRMLAVRLQEPGRSPKFRQIYVWVCTGEPFGHEGFTMSRHRSEITHFFVLMPLPNPALHAHWGTLVPWSLKKGPSGAFREDVIRGGFMF